MRTPNVVNSFWTTEKVVQTVRSILDETDNSNINTAEIRHFINISLTNLAYTSTELANAGHYGIMMYGSLDQMNLLMHLDLTKPIWIDKILDVEPAIGIPSYMPTYANNPYITPQDAEFYKDPQVEPGRLNVFNQSPELYMMDGAPIDSVEWYSNTFMPSAIIEDILDVSLIDSSFIDLAPNVGWLTPTDYNLSLTKMSFVELSHLASNPGSLKQSGAYCYFGGRIHIFLGKDTRDLLFRSAYNADYQMVYTTPAVVQVAAIRKPILDNMLDEWNEQSSYHKHIDLPDKHVRVLIMAVQKMCLDKLGKKLGPDQEAIFLRASEQQTSSKQVNDQTMVSDRFKTSQGFQTR